MNVPDKNRLKGKRHMGLSHNKSGVSRIAKIISDIRGYLTLFFIAINTIFWCIPLFFFAFLKFIFPLALWRKFCSFIVDGSATAWIGVNNAVIRLMMSIKWDVRGIENLEKKEWYMVVSNHQSWTDIVVLQKIFNTKIPFLKFFIKKELIWVPLLGLAWWALDFPFMKRYSKEFLKKNPHLKGKDVEATKKACEKYKYIPVSVMNFVEGTRFSPRKHEKQKSIYKNLLMPKAGGFGYVMSIMGNDIKYILDVTIIYPNGRLGMWDFLSGKLDEVIVQVDKIPVTDEIRGDYIEDAEFQKSFQLWINDFWKAKDEKIEKLIAERT